MVEPVFNSHLNQTLYLVYIPYNLDSAISMATWISSNGAIWGHTFGSNHTWPGGDFDAIFRSGSILFWFTDQQLAMLFALRWC